MPATQSLIVSLAEVDVSDLHKRYTQLQEKHLRTLEALAVAVQNASIAQGNLSRLEVSHAKELADVTSQHENALKEKLQEQERLNLVIASLQARLDNQAQEQELKSRMEEVRLDYEQRLEEEKRAYGRLKEKYQDLRSEHSRALGALQKSKTVVESLDKELKSTRIELTQAKEAGDRITQEKTNLQDVVRHKDLILTTVEQKYDTLRQVYSTEKSAWDSATAENDKLRSHCEKIRVEKQRLESMVAELESALEELSMGNGKSRFGEYVEMKTVNRKLQSKVSKMKRKLKSAAVPQSHLRRDSISSFSSSFGEEGNNMLLLGLAGPREETCTAEKRQNFKPRPPLKMPEIIHAGESSNNECDKSFFLSQF